MRSPRTRAALLVALLTGLALLTRLAGIGFFLPHSHEPDALVFLTQYRAHVSDRPEPWRDRYWGYYPHLVSRLAALHTVAEPPPATQAEHEHAAVAEQLYLRRLVAVLSLLSIPATYLLARKFLPRSGACIAAGLMATSLLHLWFAQQARPHAAALGFMIAAVLAQMRLRRRGDTSSYALCAVTAALSAAALQNGLAVLVSFLAAHLLRRRGRTRFAWAQFLLALLLVAATIPLAYPYLLTPRDGSAIPLFQSEGNQVTIAGQPIKLESFGDGFSVLARAFYAYEPLMSLLALVAIAALGLWLVRARRAGSRPPSWRERLDQHGDLAIALSHAVPYAIAVGLYAHSYQRFAMPLVPYLAVVSVWGLYAGAALVSTSRWLPRALALAALSLQAVPAGKLLWIRTQPDTHALAGQWIRAHAQPVTDRIVVSPRVDMPVWRTAQALARIQPHFARLFPWIEHQIECGDPPAGEPRYDVRALVVLGEDVAAAVERDPAAFLSAQPFDVLVLEISDPKPAGRGAQLRRGARAIAEPVARFGPIDDPARDDAWLYYQDDEIEHQPCWWLDVLQARRFGPTLEIYRARNGQR